MSLLRRPACDDRLGIHQTRRRALGQVALMCSSWAWAFQTQAAGYGLPKLQNLQSALRKAKDQSMPLVVMVTLEGCPYCKIVRQNYLPEYLTKGVPIVELDLSSGESIRNETGGVTTAREWARAKGVRMAPTLLWLGEHAQELVARLTGMSSADFYGAYLDERMTEALRLVRSPH